MGSTPIGVANKRHIQQKLNFRNIYFGNKSVFENMCLVFGGVAQLGEHLPCKQGVMGSNPIISTIFLPLFRLIDEKSGVLVR